MGMQVSCHLCMSGAFDMSFGAVHSFCLIAVFRLPVFSRAGSASRGESTAMERRCAAGTQYLVGIFSGPLVR